MTPVWLVLPDPFSSRLFFDTGIVDNLRSRLGERLELFLLDTGEQSSAWSARAGAARVTRPDDLAAAPASLPTKVVRRADSWLDDRFGFYPLSLRHSLRHGFNRERMRPGHQNWFLDPTLAGPLPGWAPLDRVLMRWLYGRLRYVPSPLFERLRVERPAIALANIQMHAVVPYIVGGRRLGLPLVGHIASWDHTVGKGIVSPHLHRYIVQNEVMRDDLVRYHEIEPRRVVVSGWPQTDVFHRKRPRAEYESVLRGLGLDPGRPVVLVMGNTLVSNAGTILLDALVNDRPAVCVLYDEGAPPGESWAMKNVSGDHYKALLESEAFYRAHRFEEVTAGIERALGQPAELAGERVRVAREVVGDVDGRAAERVADAVVQAVE